MSRDNKRNKGHSNSRDDNFDGSSRIEFLTKKICWLTDENKMLKRDIGWMRSALDQIVSIVRSQGHIVNLKREKRNSIPYFNDTTIDILDENTQDQFYEEMDDFEANNNLDS